MIHYLLKVQLSFICSTFFSLDNLHNISSVQISFICPLIKDLLRRTKMFWISLNVNEKNSISHILQDLRDHTAYQWCCTHFIFCLSLVCMLFNYIYILCIMKLDQGVQKTKKLMKGENIYHFTNLIWRQGRPLFKL